jgi:hypothetical protein
MGEGMEETASITGVQRLRDTLETYAHRPDTDWVIQASYNDIDTLRGTA